MQDEIVRTYASGARYVVERYREGIPEGLWEYFYENGSQKSLIPHVNGRLDGAVRLYYPDGHLKREIHFSAGKRHGVERMWHKNHTLVLESFFEEGKLVKGSCRWYPSGQKAEELVLSGETYSVKQWDEVGALAVDLEEIPLTKN